MKTHKKKPVKLTTWQRHNKKITGCFTEQAFEAFQDLMTQNPNQTKSNIICASVIYFHGLGGFGYDANLHPLTKPPSLLKVPSKVIPYRRRANS